MTDQLERLRRKWARTDGCALVVGSKVYGEKEDRRQLYPDAIGVDLLEGYGVDLVHNMESPLPLSIGQFSHVDCCSVLEHVRHPWLMAASIEAAMCDGATLLVSVPFAWRRHAYPSDYWRMTPEALEVLFPSIQWIRRGYVVNGRMRSIVPGANDGNLVYIERAETVGIGCKLTS